MKQAIGWALLFAVMAACGGSSGTEGPVGGAATGAGGPATGAPPSQGNFTLKGKSFR